MDKLQEKLSQAMVLIKEIDTLLPDKKHVKALFNDAAYRLAVLDDLLGEKK